MINGSSLLAPIFSLIWKQLRSFLAFGVNQVRVSCSTQVEIWEAGDSVSNYLFFNE